MDDVRPPKPREATPRPLLFKPAPPKPTTAAPLETSSPPSEPPRQLPKQRKPWRWIIAIIAAIALLVIAAAVAGFLWYKNALQPRSTTDQRVRITVESGETAETIGKELQQKSIIKSSLAFQWYVSQHRVLNDLKAGSYLFSPTQSVPEIVQWLVDGKIDNYNVTILPGQTLEEIKTKLIKDGFDASEIDAAMTKQYDHPLLKDKPADANLDGYIYPETYQVTSETTPEQLFTLAFDTFYQRIQQKKLEPALAQHGFNLHQGITLASLVQLEVSTESDRQQVAQVFEKRLQVDMPLGSDVSYLYAAKLLGKEPSLNIDSPYNTRIHKGLPPGAVANFNLPALEAVANPTPGDYLFFVAGDDGTTYFSKTEQEHQENINKYCHDLCSSE